MSSAEFTQRVLNINGRVVEKKKKNKKKKNIFFFGANSD